MNSSDFHHKGNQYKIFHLIKTLRSALLEERVFPSIMPFQRSRTIVRVSLLQMDPLKLSPQLNDPLMLSPQLNFSASKIWTVDHIELRMLSVDPRKYCYKFNPNSLSLCIHYFNAMSTMQIEGHTHTKTMPSKTFISCSNSSPVFSCCLFS